MPDPFFGVETGLRALRTAQAAMDTAAHNIANANTPGYSRQRVEFQTTDAYAVPSQWYKIGALQIGTGVQARSITQARDNALDVQVREGLSGRSALLARQNALAQVEEAVGEPSDNGIKAVMMNFYNAFHDLANNAESGPLRYAVVASAQSIATTFHQVSARLETVQTGLSDRITSGVGEVNGIARQIASLNTQIRKVLAQGDQPNDLRDQRNNLLDALAKKANTTVIPNGDGTITVQIGGVALVRGTIAHPIASAADLTANGDLTSGELRGVLDAQARVTAYQDDLDHLAATFMDQTNAQHQAGLDKTGAPGEPLFTMSGGTGAARLEVNVAVAGNPDRVAAAEAPIPPATFAVGNGHNALALAGLANVRVTTAAINNQSLRDFWGGAAAGLGVEVKTLNDSVAGHEAFVQQLESRREAVSGVSLDDEMADLVKFQRAYQAAAKLISISDDMTATLINSFGGRA